MSQQLFLKAFANSRDEVNQGDAPAPKQPAEQAPVQPTACTSHKVVHFEQQPTPAAQSQGTQRHTSKRGVLYEVRGEVPLNGRGIQDIPSEERRHLLFRNPEAAAYFKDAQHMFYYPQGAIDVRTPECSSGMVPHALRDHCADVNLVTQSFAERKGWRFQPTSTSLSMGTDAVSYTHLTLPTIREV